MPLFVIFFGIAGLTSLGLPGLSGFVAEFHIFAGTIDAFPLFAALGILSAGLTAVYVLRLMGRAALGPFNPRWGIAQGHLPQGGPRRHRLDRPDHRHGHLARPVRRPHRAIRRRNPGR